MSKQILTRINNLISHIEDLLENNLDIRRELIRIKSELYDPVVLRDINGIKVYKGSSFCDDEPLEPKNIKIGEEIDKSLVFDEEEEMEGWNGSFHLQDCGGNIIPITEIPRSDDTLVSATFFVSNN